MPDQSCPECQGSGQNRAGLFCEVCQIKPRASDKILRAMMEAIKPRGLGLDRVAELFGEGSPVHVEARRLLEANREAREAALYPPEWLFRVRAVVDHPPGSGVKWPSDDYLIGDGKTARVVLDVIAASENEAKDAVRLGLARAGHTRARITSVQRMDQETEMARNIARDALQRARLGT